MMPADRSEHFAEYQKKYTQQPEVKARRAAWMREWRAKNKEKVAAANRKWREANIDEARARSRRWHQDNRERAAAYKQKKYAESRDRIAVKGRIYREANKEKLKQQKLVYLAVKIRRK